MKGFILENEKCEPIPIIKSISLKGIEHNIMKFVIQLTSPLQKE